MAVAGLSAAVALLADAQPTGNGQIDGFWRAMFGAGLALAAADARRWSWFPVAGLAAAAASGSLAAVAGGAALVLTLLAGFVTERRRWIGAIVGALAAQAILRGTTYGFTGLPTLFAIAACVPIVISLYQHASHRTRSTARAIAVLGLVLGTLLTTFTAVSAARARDSVSRAIDFGNQAVSAAEQGDQELAAILIAAAGDELGGIADDFNQPWLALGRFVPILGQHSRALRTVADAGSEVAASTANALALLDAQRLVPAGGQVDLAEVALVTPALAELFEDLNRSLERIDAIDRTWIARPAADRIDQLAQEMRARTGPVSNAGALAQLAPAMLGADGERRYLVVFMTPAESRGVGGFAGNWAEIVVDNGRLSVTISGRGNDINNALPGGQAELVDPTLPGLYEGFRLTEVFQNLTVIPDFPSVAREAAAFYEQATGVTIDAVVGVDPAAMAGLVTLAGPVEVDGRTLTSGQVEDFVLRGQYVEYADDNDQRLVVLEQLTRVVFDQLLADGLPSPWTVAQVLGPLVSEDHLRIASFDSAEAAALQSVGLAGEFPQARGQDLLAVVTQNVGENKIDVFLERSISYEVAVNPATGAVAGRLNVELTNNAPAQGLPEAIIGSNDRGFPLGTNVVRVQIYSPLELRSASLDSTPASVRWEQELGWFRYTQTVQLAPGQSQTLELELAGRVDTTNGYELAIHHQPVVNPDIVSVNVLASEAWRISEVSGWSALGDAKVELSAGQTVRVRFDENLE